MFINTIEPFTCNAFRKNSLDKQQQGRSIQNYLANVIKQF